jgi:hypothetical protein
MVEIMAVEEMVEDLTVEDSDNGGILTMDDSDDGRWRYSDNGLCYRIEPLYTICVRNLSQLFAPHGKGKSALAAALLERMAPVLPSSLSPHICVLPSPDLTDLLVSSSLPPLPHILQSFSPLPQSMCLGTYHNQPV